MAGRLYSTARWQRRRAQQLRAEPLCRICMAVRNKPTRATVADHVERHEGDEEKFWYGALQSLCASCHNSIKQQQEKSGGRFRGCDVNGRPLDASHWWNK